MIPLSWYLILAAAIFCIGLYGVLARRNAIAILMGIELMLTAAIINLVAFWRYGDVANIAGQAFAVVVLPPRPPKQLSAWPWLSRSTVVAIRL